MKNLKIQSKSLLIALTIILASSQLGAMNLNSIVNSQAVKSDKLGLTKKQSCFSTKVIMFTLLGIGIVGSIAALCYIFRDVNKIGSDGYTPLTRATTNGDTKEVEKLLKNPKVDVNKCDKFGLNAIIWACKVGTCHKSLRLKILKKLLQHPNIDVNFVGLDDQKQTALSSAKDACDNDILAELKKHPKLKTETN